MMLGTKDLVFKERLARKLTEWYIGPYVIEEVISANTVKLRLLVSMTTHSVVKISRIVRYIELVKGQRVEEPKLIEMDGEEEWEVEKILKKRIVQEYVKYLVKLKGFTAEHNI